MTADDDLRRAAETFVAHMDGPEPRHGLWTTLKADREAIRAALAARSEPVECAVCGDYTAQGVEVHEACIRSEPRVWAQSESHYDATWQKPDPTVSEPRAEGLHRPEFRDDVPTGWCECGSPYPHMTVAAAPPAEGLDHGSVERVARDAIGLFVEYRDKHGRDEAAALEAAVQEVIEGSALALEQPE